MLEPVANSEVLRFGTYEVDLRLGELRKSGIRVKLTGQPFQILVILLERPGDLVTREQLQRRLWPSDTFVDFESGLNAAINRVREALGDSAENPRFVETLPRRGYRFIAPLVDSRPASATLPAASSISSEQPATSPGAFPVSEARERRPVSRRLKVLLGVVSIFAVLAVALALLSRLSRRGNEWDFQAMKLSRVTQSGNAVNVAISPDGHYVVYVLREGEKQSLNVRQVATGSDVQILPPDEVWFWGLTFSPDANYIDFVRSEKNNPYNTYLYRMPVLGGTPHRAMQGAIDGSNSYSPDGTKFAFLRVGGPGGEQIDVLIADADGTKERVIATRPYLSLISGTAWSPDGKTIAFTAWEAKGRIRGVLWAVSIGDGTVRAVYSTQGVIGRPRWLPDGSGLLASIVNVNQSLGGQLWFISFPKGQARRLTNDLMNYQDCCLDLTQDGRTLVDTELTKVSDLWVAPAGDTTKARQITPRGPAVGRFSWTPDGRIVFAEGDGHLIALNPDGSGRTLLTSNDGESWDPSVCGNGRYIVYSRYREQRVGIWRMDVDGSNPMRIADETLAGAPQCSPDGRWVIYIQGNSSIPVRVAIDGNKPPEPLAQSPAVGLEAVVAISPEGKRIAYLAWAEAPDNLVPPPGSRPNQLRVIAIDGGALLHQLDFPAAAGSYRWAPGGEAVDYVLTRKGVDNIWRQNLAGGSPTQITNFQSGQIFDFDWSRDGRQLALTRGSETSDVILITSTR